MWWLLQLVLPSNEAGKFKGPIRGCFHRAGEGPTHMSRTSLFFYLDILSLFAQFGSRSEISFIPSDSRPSSQGRPCRTVCYDNNKKEKKKTTKGLFSGNYLLLSEVYVVLWSR